MDSCVVVLKSLCYCVFDYDHSVFQIYRKNVMSKEIYANYQLLDLRDGKLPDIRASRPEVQI